MQRYGAAMLILMLAACAPRLDGTLYDQQQPRFDLFAFFDGDVRAWGIVQGRDGELIQRFTVDINGRLSDGVLTLDETFVYGLGNGPEKRIWTIGREPDGPYRGSATDIPGPAQGRAYGNAFYWTYGIDLPWRGTTVSVTFDDWIWAFDARRIVNRSYITKFGVTVAEVTIFMEKRS